MKPTTPRSNARRRSMREMAARRVAGLLRARLPEVDLEGVPDPRAREGAGRWRRSSGRRSWGSWRDAAVCGRPSISLTRSRRPLGGSRAATPAVSRGRHFRMPLKFRTGTGSEHRGARDRRGRRGRLTKVPGVGKKTAKAAVEAPREKGAGNAIDDLLREALKLQRQWGGGSSRPRGPRPTPTPPITR